MRELTPSQLQRLRSSLDAKLRNAARVRGTHPTYIRHQYVFALFFKRLFARNTNKWMLLGGNALLIRTGGGRFTQDIDLARSVPWDSVAEITAELRDLVVRPTATDPFRFEVRSVTEHSKTDPYGYGAATLKASIIVFLGAVQFHSFTVDITTQRHITVPVDLVYPAPVIDHDTLENLPPIPTVPVENHLADKLCALYELHGPTRTQSTRYRDLADIVRIVQQLDFNATLLVERLTHEAGRRRLTLPHTITSPGTTWDHAFPAQAKTFTDYPAELCSLQASLNVAAACLNPILDGSRRIGQWDHSTTTWIDKAADGDSTKNRSSG